MRLRTCRSSIGQDYPGGPVALPIRPTAACQGYSRLDPLMDKATDATRPGRGGVILGLLKIALIPGRLNHPEEENDGREDR